MSIFVTGATGVLGRPVVRELVQRGRRVHALCRSPDNRKMITQLGAVPEDVDLYDVDALTPVLERCDTVLHLATRIPPSNTLRKAGVWDENDRIRRDGMASIVQAARSAGTVETLLYPSISLFYGDGGTHWLDAGNAEIEPACVHRSTLDAEAEIGAFAGEDERRRGIVLRFGTFYGPASADSRQGLTMARKGLFMPLAPPSAHKSMIWIDDAAQAVVRAIDDAPSGIYDVVEDTPFTQRQAADTMAASVGRPKLRMLPRLLLLFAVPAELRYLLARSQRISNKRFRNATGWQPSVPSQADGWRRLAETVAANQ